MHPPRTRETALAGRAGARPAFAEAASPGQAGHSYVTPLTATGSSATLSPSGHETGPPCSFSMTRGTSPVQAETARAATATTQAIRAEEHAACQALPRHAGRTMQASRPARCLGISRSNCLGRIGITWVARIFRRATIWNKTQQTCAVTSVAPRRPFQPPRGQY
jgi:hypothetical protein